ncbi:MAG TPA: protoporphyrinogen IX oxidase [Bacteroidetes bacterium]|nr:protoporphyrinogen IX oxidase [Bacteroidota bacterium]
MSYLYLKATHIIFVVTWFSGMFYLGRLFIYNREAMDKPEPERSILQRQFNIMIHRLYWAITFPSVLITLILGSALAINLWPFSTWLWLKLVFVLVLLIYHYTLHLLVKQQKAGVFRYSSHQLRIWNEVPTILLVSIVMLAIVKQGMSLVYGLAGLAALILLLITAITIYRKSRKKSGSM